MERRVIRGGRAADMSFPDCATLHPGYGCHFFLDICLHYSYTAILAPVKDVTRRHTASWGRGRCPRVGLQPAPGRLGYQSPGIMTGAGGASLDWDRRRRVTPVQTTSPEAWPEADLGDEILPEMRAAVERRQACALQKGARRIARCGGGTRRLPAFRFLQFFVARVEQSETRERQS